MSVLLSREERVVRALVRTGAPTPLEVEALRQQVVALSVTVDVLLATLADAGIPLAVPGAMDFTRPSNSGLLALHSFGGM